MSIRTVETISFPSLGYERVEVEVTDENGSKRTSFEVHCTVCDYFSTGLTAWEAGLDMREGHVHTWRATAGQSATIGTKSAVPSIDMTTMLTVPKAAELLERTTLEVYELIDAGELQAWRVENHYEVKVEDVEALRSKVGP